MESLWSPYGIRMESLWNVTHTIPGQRTSNRLATRMQVRDIALSDVRGLGSQVPGWSFARTLGTAYSAQSPWDDSIDAPLTIPSL